MLKRTLALLLILAAGAAAQPATEQITRADVNRTLDSLEQKFDWLDYRTNLESWNMYTTGSADSLQFYQGLYGYVVSRPGLLRTLEQGKVFLTEDLDRRRLSLIESAVRLGRVESSRAVARLRDSLEKLQTGFRPTFDGRAASRAELAMIVRTDRDRQRREEAYRASCAVGQKVAPGLTKLFHLRNDQAADQGKDNFFNMTFAVEGFDVSNYLLLLNRLDSLSEQPYRDILNRIQQKLNYDRLEIWDLGFAYADIDARIDNQFPVDSQIVFAQTSLRKLGFDLDDLPIYFDLQASPEGAATARAFPIKAPYDVRVLADLTDGFESMHNLMSTVGRALYLTNISQDRRLFVDHIAPAWAEGQGKIIARLCDNAEWLQEYAHVPPATAREWLQSRQEQEIINLRLSLTRLMFEYEAYNNPDRDLNKLYWDLFEKYMMLPRHEDIKPWAAVLQYTTRPVYQQNHLYGDIISAQTLKALTRLYGDIVDNPSVRSFLVQNYYRFGSRYSWRDLLERGTGGELDPKFLVARLGL